MFLRSIQSLSNHNLTLMTEELTPAEMSLIHCAAVYTENNAGEYITVAQAAAEMKVSMPAVSRTLKGLQNKEYIERRTDESDRRSVRIVVTEKGFDALKHAAEHATEVLQRILSNFTDEELHTIIKLHCKFTSLMSEEITKQKTSKRKEQTDA